MPLDVWTHPEAGTDPPVLPTVPPTADLRFTHGLLSWGGPTLEPYDFIDRELRWPNAGFGPSRVPFTLSTVQANEIDYEIGRDDLAFPYVLRPIYPYPTSANRPLYFELDLQSMKGTQPYQARVHEPSFGPSGYLFP